MERAKPKQKIQVGGVFACTHSPLRTSTCPAGGGAANPLEVRAAAFRAAVCKLYCPKFHRRKNVSQKKWLAATAASSLSRFSPLVCRGLRVYALPIPLLGDTSKLKGLRLVVRGSPERASGLRTYAVIIGNEK